MKGGGSTDGFLFTAKFSAKREDDSSSQFFYAENSAKEMTVAIGQQIFTDSKFLPLKIQPSEGITWW